MHCLSVRRFVRLPSLGALNARAQNCSSSVRRPMFLLTVAHRRSVGRWAHRVIDDGPAPLAVAPSLARSERSYPLRDGVTIGGRGRAIKAPVLLRPSLRRRKWVCKTKEGMTDGRLLWKWRKSGEKRRGGGVRTEKEAEIGVGGSPKPMVVLRIAGHLSQHTQGPDSIRIWMIH